jgi:DNA-binding NarL/FixJ family response regulator
MQDNGAKYYEGSSYMSIVSKPAIRILIVDDHSLYRQTLRMLCEIKGGFQVVGEAENGLKAVEKARQLKPDVILMDLRMPVLSGIEATGYITEMDPTIRIIMLTAHAKDEYLLDALKAGACGYLLKDVDVQTLIKSIQAAYRGETLLDSFLTAQLCEEFRRLSQTQSSRLDH